MIRVVVSGACGRMGQEVVQTVLRQDDMRLVGAIDVNEIGADVGVVASGSGCGVEVHADAARALAEADVVVDFTRGDAAPHTLRAAVERGVACVVGTTGISADDRAALDAAARERGVPLLLAPNFALGAVLMMRFAQEAARFYEWAEVIEMHHENKIDAPSGTALRTAELMAAVRPSQRVRNETEKVAGARGGDKDGVRVHSIRLPGLVAHQEVILGGQGETLTIRHDSMHRSSFMPGVMLAVRKVRTLGPGLTHGLEALMF